MVGDFAASSFDEPKTRGKGKSLIIEVTDTSSNIHGSSVMTGDWIDAVVDQFCPKPVRYKQVWSKLADGKPSLYCWKPVPVNTAKFIALGVVFTTIDEPPVRNRSPHLLGLTSPPIACLVHRSRRSWSAARSRSSGWIGRSCHLSPYGRIPVRAGGQAACGASTR